MSRRLRTIVPVIPELLKPKLADIDTLKEREQKYKEKMRSDFDRHHNAKEPIPLAIGSQVWVPDQQQYGSIIASPNPRSYIIQTPSSQIRRNRRSLNLIPSTDTSSEAMQPTGQVSTQPTVDPDPLENPTTPATDESEPLESPETSPQKQGTVLCSGRVSKPPLRLDL